VDAWLQFFVSAAFMAGLLGGVHCAAMCGGVIAACAGSARAPAQRWRFALAYNAGRLASYAIAGALAGALGQGALQLRGGATMQQAMLMFAGASMLLIALYLGGVTSVARRLELAGSYVWRHIQPYSRSVLPADTLPRSLALGALWGWLPCGMVYGVLLTAVASADAARGALVMLAFGAGTLPNVLALTVFTQRVRSFTRSFAARIAVALLVAAAGLYAILMAAHPTVAHH
jgi:sulfite exporter TauE/SafE